ncbi:kynurenine-oxoglutarate transaminase [Cavenderia fasciculata]|uniref:kynurenine--oxoglutarate transaminase n=1 Tax=Cavenderia fasciculata TaxID=261658 RepID=F4QEV2_CACFS|nr:kynurenine-oxoglutarate transaminase [Cavenderia fasciculata]EGG14159.1 kynurenine-oxoglutarate transaminase [Cavenderia fasciculata]|eukprot:XP_004350867.1 kynurenine-oxoglutarate transaminase [Cavenderia fasciculata]
MIKRSLQLMSNTAYKFVPSPQASHFGPSVWVEFSPLSIKHKSINLGQGFPDFEPPQFVSDALAKTVETGGFNQYARSPGHLRLVNAISKVYSPYFERTIEPTTEVVTTVGASEAIFCAIQTCVGQGDEVILIEPFFDIYSGAVVMAGGVSKHVPLREQPRKNVTDARSSANWELDWDEFEKAFTPKTRVLLLNNPHNPVGKVWSRAELERIAEIVKRHPQVTVISDEVYEWMTYDGIKHERFATIKDMYDRTITVGSAGKTFSITGWKIGWCIGPKNIISAIANVHQYIPFSVHTPSQEAVAIALEETLHRDYLKELAQMYQGKRDRLVTSLRQAGLDPVVPQGTYFVLGDTSRIHLQGDEGQSSSITGMGKHLRDWNVCRWLTTDIGVTAIPISAFYSEEHAHLPANYARFCFCKKDQVLDQADKAFQQIKNTKNFNIITLLYNHYHLCIFLHTLSLF